MNQLRHRTGRGGPVQGANSSQVPLSPDKHSQVAAADGEHEHPRSASAALSQKAWTNVRRCSSQTSVILGITVESWRQTCRDIGRAKCTYCIGCCSIFLVVIVAALAQTLIARAPLIFLREAEVSSGQVDVRITASDDSASTSGQLLNYTQFAASINQSPRELASAYSYTTGRSVLQGRLYPQLACANKYRDVPLTSLEDWPYVKYYYNDSTSRPGYSPQTAYGGSGGNPNSAAPSQRDPFSDSLVRNPLVATAQPIDAGYCNSYLTCVPDCAGTGGVRFAPGGASNYAELVLIHTAREKRAGMGRGWTFHDQAGAIPFGSAVLSPSLVATMQKAWRKAAAYSLAPMGDQNAADVGNRAADTAFATGGQLNLWLPTRQLLRAVLPPLMTKAVAQGLDSSVPPASPGQRQQASSALAAALAALVDQLSTYESTVLPVSVYGVASDKEMKSKFGSSDGNGYGSNPLIMESDYLLPLVIRSLHPAVRRALVNVLRLSGISPLPWSNAATKAMVPAFAATTSISGTPSAAMQEEAGYLARYAVASDCALSTDTLPSASFSFSSSCASDHAVTEIVANLPPGVRLGSTAYAASNYDRLRAAVADFASSMLYLSGFTETKADAPILTLLEPRRFITLYLGLVLDILLLTLFGLSIILIYSLLLANVESKTFEVAVRRMIGSGRPAIVLLQLSHAAAHALPAWIIGLVLAQIGAAVLFSSFGKAASLPIPTTLTSSSIVTATALAWAIPAVAVIGPIRTALKSNIHDALDPGKPSAAAGVKIRLEQRSTGRMGSTAIVIGLTTAIFGFAIYYLLPLALISSNYTLLINLFLVIILGMLLGLVLLSLNLELLLLRLLVWITVGWWEHTSVRKILWSNLSSAHRKRNRKTATMYALAIALIVFITVAATGQISSASYSSRQRAGAAVTYSNQNSGNVQQATDEAVIAVYETLVRQATLTGSVSGVDSGAQIPGISRQADMTTLVTGLANPLPVSLSDGSDLAKQQSGYMRHSWASGKLEGVSAWVATAAMQRDDFTSASLPMTNADASSGATLAMSGSRQAATLSSTPQYPWQLRLKPEYAWMTTPEANGGASQQQSGDAIWSTSDIQQRNKGRSSKWPAGVRGVSPTFYRGSTYADVLAVEKAGELTVAAAPKGSSSASASGGPSNGDNDAAYSISDALYTAEGSSGALLSNNIVFELDAEVDKEIVLQTTLNAAVTGNASDSGPFSSFSAAGRGGGPWWSRSEHRALAMISSSPFYFFSRAPTSADTVLMPLTSLAKLVTAHVEAVAGPRTLPQVEHSTLASASHLYGLGPHGNRTVAYCRDYLLNTLGMGKKGLPLSQVKVPTCADGNEWAVCLLKVMDNQALGIEALEATLLPQNPAAANATNNATSAIANLVGGAGGGVLRYPRSSGGVGMVLPLSLSDIPVQLSFVPAQESVEGVSDGSYLTGPLKNIKASTLTAQLQAAMSRAVSNLNAARWYLGGATATSRAGNHLLKAKMSASSYDVNDGTSNSVDVDQTTTLLQLIFGILAAIAMVLCFFSLSASMLSNIREQQREVGMLRALGATRPQIIRIYLHEAVLLVLSSSFLGIVIGSITSWTFSQQQSLLSGLPVPFVLPWGVISVVVIFSFGLGIFAAGIPAWRSVKQPITKLLRGA